MSLPPITQRLDELLSSNQPTEDPTNESFTPISEGEKNLENSEPVQVAGLGRLVELGTGLITKPVQAGAQFISEAAAPEVLAPIVKKGVKSKVDPKVTPDPLPIAPTPPAPTVAAEVAPTIPKAEAPAPVSGERMMEQAAERERIIQAGGEPGAPSPTAAQAAAGVTETPISTLPFDNETMQATVRSAAESVLKDEPSMSIRSIYMRAVSAGVPETHAERILQGLPMESSVGGSQLAQQVAGVLKLHDDSASLLDNLFGKMAAGQLDDTGKLQLRQQMAYHDNVVKNLKGIQVDIGRTMNVFKRVQDKGPGFKPTDIRAILDEVGGDESLSRLAEAYLLSPTRAGKNKLLEVGFGKKLSDAFMFTFQSNLMTNPDSHAYNFVSGALFGPAAPIERTLAVGYGKIRQAIIPNADKDRFFMGDVLARTSGLANGILDGWDLLKHVVRTGERATAKGDVKINPLSAEAFSDVPVRVGNIATLPISPILGGLSDFGKEIYRTPDLTNTWIGKGLDYLGLFHGSVFRAISGADEFIGGISARMQLHEDAWRFANTEYDKLIASGMTEADALKETQRLVAALMDERPATMAANVENFRKQSQLATEFDRSTKLGEFYWKLNDMFQIPALKVFVPFAKTISNVFIESSARVPGMNLLSPRFWDDYDKGGRYRDLAMARLSAGGLAVSTFAYLSMNNRVTGSGPSQPEDLAALEKIGYQRRSLIYKKDEISFANLSRLSQLTKITTGQGPLEGYIFISYARFDPLSLPINAGADIGDALKFHRGKPDEPMIMNLVLAGSGASAEYMTNIPAMQGIGDMVSILKSRQEDGGRKVVDIFDRLAKQYANYLFTGIPGIGFANSSLMAKMERLTDPTIRSTRPSEADVPLGMRFFAEQRAFVQSRIPYLSQSLEPELDSLGRVRKVENRGLDYWANYSPITSVTVGKRSLADEALVSIDYGISRPRDTWDGVKLSAKQFNRYKELYGQVVKIAGSDGQERNLERAIPFELTQAREDAINAGESFTKGEMQKFVDRLTSNYRRIAKLRMIGFDPSPDAGQSEAANLDEAGFLDEKIEFPDLAKLVRRNKEFIRIEGK